MIKYIQRVAEERKFDLIELTLFDIFILRGYSYVGKNQSLLTMGRVGKLMRKYALPSVISLLVGALYNIDNQIFITNVDYLGSYGNAANTVVFPLIVIALGLTVMIGDGSCAFVGISLGEGDKIKQKKYNY